MTDKPKETKVPIYNRGQRTFHTSVGALGPGKTHHLPEDEAKKLEGYDDIVDARNIVEPEDFKLKIKKITDERDALKAENENLKAEVEKLKKK